MIYTNSFIHCRAYLFISYIHLFVVFLLSFLSFPGCLIIRSFIHSSVPVFVYLFTYEVQSMGVERKRYKDCLKSTLKLCSIDVDNWERIAQDRKSWLKVVSGGPSDFEARRISDAETKRYLHKSRRQDLQ